MCNLRKLLKWMWLIVSVVEIINGHVYELENVRIPRQANGGRKHCPNRSAFACKSGECINEDKECDGIVDCKDGTDETNACHRIKCPPFLFRCNYGACIDPIKECDGKPDCRDKSDETTSNCKNTTLAETCRTNQFKCSSGQCIDEEFKCDGKADCRDESDEIHATCWNFQCPGFTYRCRYGACVDGDAECDGQADCYDGSDEDHCKPNLESGSCVLPDFPAFGNWTVIGPGTFSPKMKVDGGTILQIQCQEEYVLQGSSSLVCRNGTWTSNIGKCVESSSKPSIPEGSGSCTLPEYPENGTWSVYKSSQTYSPGTQISDGRILIINCRKDYVLDGTSPITCVNGSWSSPIGKCLRTCPPRNSTSILTVTCSYNNKELSDCTNPVDGTLAKFKCASFYEDPSLNRHPVHVCKDGTWNYQAPECIPACGIKSVSPQTLIINGTNVKTGDYPWQVAIYTEKQPQDKQFICGGSLISQKVILTAAHCITDESGKLKPKEEYIVAVGKYYRKFDDNRDKNYAQISTLEKHFIAKHYKGPTQNYLGDIAVLVTKKTFQLSLRVQPVCVDYGSNYYMLGEYGYVTGWGLTSENENPSEELKELKVPLVSDEKCTQELPEDYYIYLTNDKLCAGYLDRGSGVCKGDSGGGLVVKRSNGRYFITGIVSLSPQSPLGGCDKQQYGLYTRVQDYIQFITEIETQFQSH